MPARDSREMGAKVEETRVESMEYALAAYYVVAMAEASSNLSRYDGVRYGASTEKGTADWNAAFAKTRTECFGPEVKRRILLGSFVLSAGYYEAYYLKAQRARGLLRREFEKAFKSYDVLLGPTMPVLPPRIGEKVTPLEDYMIDVNTVPANLVGIPSLSVPAGFAEGLPVGMQLMAPHFGEDRLFEAAQSYEDAPGSRRRKSEQARRCSRRGQDRTGDPLPADHPEDQALLHVLVRLS